MLILKIALKMVEKIYIEENLSFYENKSNSLLLHYLNSKYNNTIIDLKKNDESDFSIYLTKNEKEKIEKCINKLENIILQFEKNKQEILLNMNILDSNFDLIVKRSEEYKKTNYSFIQLLKYYYNNYKLNEMKKTLTKENTLNLMKFVSLIHFSEFKFQNIEKGKIINRNPIIFLNFISNKETNLFQKSNEQNFNFSKLERIKEEYIENILQMIILKDEEICILTNKILYFFDPYSLQLNKKFDNISNDFLICITQINDGRLFIGCDNNEISIWKIEKENWININKINQFNVHDKIFNIIELNNNIYGINSYNQTITLIHEIDFNYFEIIYVFLNDFYFDIYNDFFSVLKIDNQLISYSKGMLSLWNYEYLKKIDKCVIDFNDEENYDFYMNNLIDISKDLIGVISNHKIYIINLNNLQIFSLINSIGNLHYFLKYQNEIFCIEDMKTIKKLYPYEIRLENTLDLSYNINQFFILKNNNLILYNNSKLILFSNKQ